MNSLLKSWSLTKKLWALALFPVLVLGIVLFVGHRSRTMVSRAVESQEKQMNDLKVLGEAQLWINSVNLVAMDAIVDRGSRKVAQDLREEYTQGKVFLGKNLEKINEIARQEPDSENNLKSLASTHDLLAGVEKLFAMVEKGISDADVAKFDDIIDGNAGAIVETISSMKSGLEKKSHSALAETNLKMEQANFVNLVTSFLGILLIFSLAYPIIKAIMASLDRTSSFLASTVESLTDCSRQIKQSAEHLSATSSQQAAAVQESVTAMSEISSMVAQTSKSATQSALIANRTVEKSEEGHRTMEKMASAMGSIQAANSQLQNISKIIEEIEGKTKFINDIVFKTQMLSFNAAIEAVRAGAHGRGFSVVADEVGKLAQMSGDSASAIQGLLKDSKAQVASILELTESRVVEGQDVSQEALKSFGEITRGVKEITEQNRNIAKASSEQEIGINQTTQAMNHVDQASKASRDSATRASEIAQKIAKNERDLNRALEDLVLLINGNQFASHSGTNVIVGEFSSSKPQESKISASDSSFKRAA